MYFSPCGWDNEKKISILYENMTSMKPEDLYEDVIVKPVVRKVKYLENYTSNVGFLRSNLCVCSVEFRMNDFYLVSLSHLVHVPLHENKT